MARDINAFQRELDRDAKRKESWGSKGGSGDFKFFNPSKPAKIGEASRQELRILPRLDANGEPEEEFWVAVDQHILTIDGQTKVIVCPDNHDSGDEQTCPICILSRELYKAQDPKYLDTAKDLSTRRRVYVNAVHIDEMDKHVSEGWSYVWAFSQSVLTGLMDICVAKRAFIDDVNDGRNVMLSCKRVGSQKRDVRYSVTDMDPSALDPQHASVLLQNLNSLEDLAKKPDPNELREIAAMLDPRPGSKRSSHIVTGSVGQATIPTAPAPTPMAAPAPPAPPAPPKPAAAAVESDTLYHYSGDAGEHPPMGASALASIVANNPGDHHVWVEGWGEWKAAEQVPEIAAIIQAAKAPSNPVPPPPRSPVGPPAPPKPPGGAAF